MDNIKFIRYSRKSSETSEKQVASIEDQNLECETYAQEFNLEVVARIDEEKSAFKPNNRTKFLRMIEMVENGEANGILTWKPDRLSRNPKEGGMILQLLQDGKLKEIRTPLGESYTPDSDHLVLQIHFGMANQYSRNLSQNVKRGYKYKLQRGEYPTNAPIGYENYGEVGRKNIRPKPVEAVIISELFKLASTGRYSLSALCDIAYEKGLRNQNKRKIGVSSMQIILTRQTYYGCFMWNGELHEGNYEPIITKDLFDSVQMALSDRTKPILKEHSHPYNGLIKCGYCGCSITTTVKEKFVRSEDSYKSYTYHHCTKRKGSCDQCSISTSELNKLIFEKLADIAIDEEVWQLGLELVKEKHKVNISANKSRAESLRHKNQEFQDKLNGLIELRINNELSKEEFTKFKTRLLEDKSRIQGMISDTEYSETSWLKNMEDFVSTVFVVRETLEKGSLEDKRDLVLKIGGNCILRDKNLEITLKKPFDILLQPAYADKWLPDMDSNHD